MPTQLPREATDFFGDLLLPHVMNILKSDATQVRNIFFSDCNIFIANNMKLLGTYLWDVLFVFNFQIDDYLIVFFKCLYKSDLV